ncbi:MAG: outer membrane protein assembly factor BamD [Saprospiraceae bacterium]|nr:outer membrane protein assembly factor BamD [Saprospiraceae bacterium]MCB9324095.1 outer membrane protein assembly factor BamD [Lewinellaceae bacterium]
MNIRNIILAVIALTVFASCKSEFEKTRASGDPKLILAKADAYYADDNFQKAQSLYELVISSYRGQKEAEEIYYKYAYTYYYQEQYVLAAYYFNIFSKTYSTSDRREEIDYMAAYCNYKMSPTFRLDQTYTIEAINGLQTFINTYPFSERVGECNNLIDEMRKKLEQKAFEEGKLYYDIKRYQASIQSFGNLLVDFPETAEAEQVRYLISRSAYLWASNSFREKQKERYELAIEKAQDYLDLFANGANNKEVENMLNNSREKLNSLNNDGHQKQSSRAGS